MITNSIHTFINIKVYNFLKIINFFKITGSDAYNFA